jgi:hypothetical protein
MEEVGLMNDEPTTTYQDNLPAIQILNQKGSLASMGVSSWTSVSSKLGSGSTRVRW